MKTSRYTEAQIIAILRQAEGGVPVAQLCREHGMSDASFYKWRAKYGGMDASMVSQMKAIEDENRHQIVEAIIEQLTTLQGADVSIKLEIDAEVPGGLDRAKVRTLVENATTLGFVDKLVK